MANNFNQNEYERLNNELAEIRKKQADMKKQAGADFEKYQAERNAEKTKLTAVAQEIQKGLKAKKFTDDQIVKIAGKIRFLATPKTE